MPGAIAEDARADESRMDEVGRSRMPEPTPRWPTIDAHTLDKVRVRRLADRAARHYDNAAWLPLQVASVLMEHLQPVRIQPARILDVGAGTGICSRLLARHYRRARVISMDSSAAMLRAGRVRGPRWLSRRAAAVGDGASLPAAGNSIDLLVSSLMLPSCPTPDTVLREFHRVLKPGGLLMFSSLGPDTLRELRAAWSAVDARVHVHAFIDMHDLGDALLRAGFSDVVMDTERITGRYPQVAALMTELKRLGVSNAARGCHKSLTTPAQLAAMASEYERFRAHGDKGDLPASFEVVFGHAWRPQSRSVDVSPGAMVQAARRL
ncbi:MAG: methyltransferase domain-containing protein [Gammaproteobacteria bacterium]